MNKQNTLALAGLGPMLSISLSNFINMMFRKEEDSPNNQHQPRNDGENRDHNRGNMPGDQSSPTRKQETESNHNRPGGRQGEEQDRDDKNRGRDSRDGMPMERPANDIDEINPGNYENLNTQNRDNPRNEIEEDERER